MNIDAAACEWFKLDITTEPATTPTQWEASFDDGETWLTALSVDSVSAWLVAGPDYAGGGTPVFTSALGKTRVLVRLVDDPETVIRQAPSSITTKKF